MVDTLLERAQEQHTCTVVETTVVVEDCMLLNDQCVVEMVVALMVGHDSKVVHVENAEMSFSLVVSVVVDALFRDD